MRTFVKGRDRQLNHLAQSAILRLQEAGHTPEEVLEGVNALVYRQAYRDAIASGLSAEDAESVAQSKKLSRRTVANWSEEVQRTVGMGIAAAALLALERQLAQVRADQDLTFDLEDMAFAEIERSRDLTHSGTSETASDLHGKTVTVFTESRQNASIAPLFKLLIDNSRRRSELREEEMRLIVGANMVKSARAETAAFVKQLDAALAPHLTPEEQAVQLEAMHARELEQVARLEELAPLTDEAVRAAEAARAENHKRRLEALKTRLGILRAEGRHGPVVVAFEQPALMSSSEEEGEPEDAN
jgi:hypothetical protein